MCSSDLFHPLARWTVYRRLAADDRGRLAALVETCPALLIHDAAVALWKDDPEDPPVQGLVVAGALAGHGVRELLTLAVHEWEALAREWREPEPPEPYLAPTASGDGTPAPRWGPGLRSPWSRRLHLKNAHAAQLQLYRATPASLAPDLLFAPPPSDFDPAEIPEDPDAFARWREAGLPHG